MISSLELARRCGVSQATVDRALHNRPGISRATRDRIRREAERHGYLPNPAANEILRGDRRVIGAVLPTFSQVFFMDLMAALGRALQPYGQRVFLSPVEQARDFAPALAEFAARRVKALVVVPPDETVEVPAAIAAAVPVLSLISPCRGAGVRFITPDELQAGEVGTRYLLEQGHCRIAHVTYSRRSHAIEQRALGYTRTMQAQRLQPLVLRGVSDAELLTAIAEHHLTALFCHNDKLAARTLKLLHTAGIATPGAAGMAEQKKVSDTLLTSPSREQGVAAQPPRHGEGKATPPSRSGLVGRASALPLELPGPVSVLGVDHTPTLRELWPELTTLAYPLDSLAAHAAALINDQPHPPAIGPYAVQPRASVGRWRP